jgi:hypothetical protein
MRNKIILLVFTVALNIWEVAAQGCSQCKIISTQQSSPNEMDETAFTSNINYGIVYLMAFPYLLIMFFYRKQIITFFKNYLTKKRAV